MSTLRTAEPSLRSYWLGRHLRTLREDHGFTLRHVERILGVPYAEIKAVEQGLHHLQVSRVAALLELYGVVDKVERDLLLGLARDVRHLHRWENDVDAPPLSSAMLDFLWVESHASRIRCYSATLISDLLQIADYSEALARPDDTTAATRPQASWSSWACLERQRVLQGSSPATLYAVVAETALYRRPGRSSALVRRQLGHLVECARLPHITIRVLPTSAPYVPGMDGSFAVFDLAPARGPVAAVCGLAEPAVYEEACAKRYAAAYEQISRAALGPQASVELIAEAAKRPTNNREE